MNDTLARRERARWVLGWLGALAGYAASRAFYASCDLALDTGTLAYFWQYLDLGALREHPFEAVYYQHTQPPLYNLYLAAALASGDEDLFFHITARLFGVVLHGSLYALLLELRVRRTLAVLAVWVVAFEPGCVLMELWVFYTYPVTALLVLSAALLARGVRTSSRGALFGAFLAMAAVVLTRSLFHLGWMVLAVGLALAIARNRRRVAAMALVPLALAASLYVKNALVFGRPNASSWLGFSVSRLVTTKAPSSLIRSLQTEGAVSELADDLPWLPLASYPASWRAPPEGLPDVDVLSAPHRANGHPNFNHAAYVAISEAFLADARAVHARRPDIWWQSTRHAWRLFFLPIHDYTFFHSQRRGAGERMREVERVYERVAGADAFAEWSWDEPMPPLGERPGYLWAKLLALALLLALLVAYGDRRRGVRVAALYCVMSVAVIAVVGNSLELGENNRFRFLAQPFSWALMALAIDRALSLSRLAWRSVGSRVLAAR